MRAVVQFSLVLLASVSAFAGQSQGRQKLVCNGAKINGIKNPLLVQVQVLNSNQLEGMKIRFKNKILVNEMNKVEGELYNDGIINNHVMFTAKTDNDLSLLLPLNFQLMKATDAYLSKEEGNEVSFTALTCTLTAL